ncbi:hypothetical protein BD779DRAFT_716100 [Infundibulicybe gibba]|nr:hypothetical protein BD779DRAFT_716100 [Infundibulicybe gibba]
MQQSPRILVVSLRYTVGTLDFRVQTTSFRSSVVGQVWPQLDPQHPERRDWIQATPKSSPSAAMLTFSAMKAENSIAVKCTSPKPVLIAITISRFLRNDRVYLFQWEFSSRTSAPNQLPRPPPSRSHNISYWCSLALGWRHTGLLGAVVAVIQATRARSECTYETTPSVRIQFEVAAKTSTRFYLQWATEIDENFLVFRAQIR